MSMRPSKEAAQLIKFLSMYVSADYMHYNYGMEAYHRMDQTQRERFRNMAQGFKHARKGAW